MRGTGIASLIAYEAARLAARVAGNPFSLPCAPPHLVESLPKPWTPEVRSKGVKRWLKRSPDYVCLLNMSLYGADMAYTKGQSAHKPSGTFSNCVEHHFHEEITRQLQVEVQNGWLLPVSSVTHAAASTASNAPIIAVDEGTKIRRITDFSNKVPGTNTKRGVNQHVLLADLGEAPMHRPSDLAKAVFRLRRKHPHEMLSLIVRDLSKAFRRISVRLAHIPSLVTTWKGQTYWDLRLPFGHAASAHYCCKLTTAVAEAVTNHFSGRVECLAYVDDFVIVAPPTLQLEARTLFENIITDLGLTISKSKAAASGNWSTCAEWIGFNHDLVTLTHSLPARKLGSYLESAQLMTRQLDSGSPILTSSLRKLVGQLNHVATIFTSGRAFMRNLLKDSQSPLKRTILGPGHRKDLQWWQIALRLLPTVAAMRRSASESDPVVATDASLFGFGAVLSRTGDFSATHTIVPQTAARSQQKSPRLLAGRFGQPSVPGDMTLLEVWAVLAAIEQWGPSLQGKTIKIFVDNAAVQYAIQKGRSHSPRVNSVLRQLLLLCLRYDICIHPFHVQSSDNKVADALSRLSPIQFMSGKWEGNPFSSCNIINQHVCPQTDQPLAIQVRLQQT